MKIELKKLRTFVGREGHGYNVTIYIDDVKGVEVTDDASGGEPTFHWYDKTAEQKWDAYVASLPDWQGVCGPLKMSGDIAVSDLIGKLEQKRRVARWCKTKTPFTIKGDKDGLWRIIDVAPTEQLYEQLKKHHGDKLDIYGPEYCKNPAVFEVQIPQLTK